MFYRNSIPIMSKIIKAKILISFLKCVDLVYRISFSIIFNYNKFGANNSEEDNILKKLL